MQRLFWKFFTIIWLTMAISIAVLFAATALFQIVPFSSEVERSQRTFSLDVAAQLLVREGRESALAFVEEAAKASAPVNLSIFQVPLLQGCASVPTDQVRTVESEGLCYRIILAQQSPPSIVSETWPRVAPWLSALLAAAIAAYWLAQYLVRPVGHLRAGLSALASGRFDIRIGEQMGGRRDEVATLAHDFDTSATRLEELQRAQQRLFHDVSHELRSPLSRLQAAIGVLQQSPAKLDVTMERMVREVERIDGLVGEILTLARLTDQCADGFEVQKLDVIELLNDIVVDAAFEGETRSVRVLHEGAETFVAEVNGELIYRALENIIRNALKFTADNSSVSIGSEVDGDTLRIRVTDQGPGVPEHELTRIFLPFSRGKGTAERRGYGLGLAITKQAVERHGGRVAATMSEAGGLAISLEISRSFRERRRGGHPDIST